MNQKQLSDRVAARLKEDRVKKVMVEKVIETALSVVTDALVKGEKVRLVGFGNFLVRSRASRVGRNPQTGEKISIPQSKSPAFVPGINLKKAIKGK
jgi:nucleoid DNA-binding protein